MTETIQPPEWLTVGAKVAGTGDGTEDGEAWYIAQAWYWAGETLPRDIDGPAAAHGNSPDALRRDLRAMLAAADRPALVRDRKGNWIEEGQ